MKIGFVTGARSEYGVMKNLIRKIASDSDFDVCLYVTGMHFLNRYGYTIDEIKKDNYAPLIQLPCYTEEQRSKDEDFISLFKTLLKSFKETRPDAIYLIGDRLEAYAAALAAHFVFIPIIHFAGGQITNGAVDNIYRYNISYLSSVHLVTNKYAFDRLKELPVIDKNRVFLVGSSAVDNIVSYFKNPKTLIDLDSRLVKNSYVLMTFHSQTIGNFNVPLAMDIAIKTIIEENKKVLITYPNNDNGSEKIIQIIKKWEHHPNIIVIPNLGASNYYTAIDNSIFVIGNSSSGIIEVPYFSKFTINVGQRQEGRNSPKSVINTESDYDLLKFYICKILNQKLIVPKQEFIYGNGNSIEKIINVIKKVFI